jgi:putative tryptophan/tyrosine transport system substrate-binding protein
MMEEATMPRRRIRVLVTLALSLLAVPLAAEAPPVAPMSRVGFLHPGVLTPERTRNLDALRQELRDHGYVEGQHLTLVYRWAEGREERLPALAAELVRLPVDVLVAISPSAVHAARHATTTIPIVAHDLETDPVAQGLVASLARPGGNLTGMFFDFADFTGKWVELLKEVVPQLAHVAVLWDPRVGPVQLRAVEAAAQALGLQWHLLEVHRHDEVEGACRAAADGQAGALLALSSPLVNASRQQIVDCTLRHRLPAMTLFTGFAEDGGLMAYGPNLPATYRQLGRFVGKILQGAKPEALPVERPTKLELTINLKTAQALGLTISPTLLFQADKVIR